MAENLKTREVVEEFQPGSKEIDPLELVKRLEGKTIQGIGKCSYLYIPEEGHFRLNHARSVDAIGINFIYCCSLRIFQMGGQWRFALLDSDGEGEQEEFLGTLPFWG